MQPVSLVRQTAETAATGRVVLHERRSLEPKVEGRGRFRTIFRRFRLPPSGITAEGSIAGSCLAGTKSHPKSCSRAAMYPYSDGLQ